MATASWCYGVVPKVQFLEVPDDIRQRCSERWKGLAGRTRKKFSTLGVQDISAVQVRSFRARPRLLSSMAWRAGVRETANRPELINTEEYENSNRHGSIAGYRCRFG
jgi:hypothetical protein